MIICLCNALNDKKISSSLARSGGCTATVFKEHGCRPQCGRCLPDIREMSKTQQQNDEACCGGCEEPLPLAAAE